MPDTGASQNVCGGRWAMEVHQEWKRRGLPCRIFQHPRPKPHCGVGNGQVESTYSISVPIALGDRNHIYTAGILGGGGEGVPALMGIPDMASLGAIIDCKRGKSLLPGPGGVQISASPGTSEVQMRRESHWLLEVDPPFSKGRPRSVPASERSFSRSENRGLRALAVESPI